ncbi:unnamed protein product [Acanthosepion pharaonis]|uniref:Uncharacterized protein n=1 Tax=Acanthosepion pharaonis TaxID=158019 RepID=A0A812DFV3_ACAPH|nr:unnamed protein product [Sepia pharaonis]
MGDSVAALWSSNPNLGGGRFMRYAAQARERANARRRKRDRAARLLAFNTRWQPLLDTASSRGLAWLVMSFLSGCCLMIIWVRSAKQGSARPRRNTGRVCPPGALLVLALAALGAMFTGGAPMAASLHNGPAGVFRDPRRFLRRSGYGARNPCFVVGGLGGSILLAIGIALPVSVAAGLPFSTRVRSSFWSEGYAKPAGLLMLWVSTATLLFLVLAINLDSVLRLQFGGASHLRSRWRSGRADDPMLLTATGLGTGARFLGSAQPRHARLHHRSLAPHGGLAASDMRLGRRFSLIRVNTQPADHRLWITHGKPVATDPHPVIMVAFFAPTFCHSSMGERRRC